MTQQETQGLVKGKYPNNLDAVMKRLGISGSELGRRLGIDRQQVSRYRNGQYELTPSLAKKYASVLAVSVEEILLTKRSNVEIVGLAGAGPDGSVLFASGDGNLGTIPAPVNSTDTTEALEVRGYSMLGIASDGWIITYDEKEDPKSEMIGEPCVVWLASGRVLVKILAPGSAPGYFNLESTAAPTMRDQIVEAVALITNIIPRRAAEKYIRRHPEEEIVDLVIDRDK